MGLVYIQVLQIATDIAAKQEDKADSEVLLCHCVVACAMWKKSQQLRSLEVTFLGILRLPHLCHAYLACKALFIIEYTYCHEQALISSSLLLVNIGVFGESYFLHVYSYHLWL